MLNGAPAAGQPDGKPRLNGRRLRAGGTDACTEQPVAPPIRSSRLLAGVGGHAVFFRAKQFKHASLLFVNEQ
jgi:hypothetical protein